MIKYFILPFSCFLIISCGAYHPNALINKYILGYGFYFSDVSLKRCVIDTNTYRCKGNLKKRDFTIVNSERDKYLQYAIDENDYYSRYPRIYYDKFNDTLYDLLNFMTWASFDKNKQQAEKEKYQAKFKGNTIGSILYIGDDGISYVARLKKDTLFFDSYYYLIDYNTAKQMIIELIGWKYMIDNQNKEKSKLNN